MSIFILKDNQKDGPFEDSVVQQWLVDGTCSPDDLAWREGMKDWQPLSTLTLPKKKHWVVQYRSLLLILGVAVIGMLFVAFIGIYWYVSSNSSTGFSPSISLPMRSPGAEYLGKWDNTQDSTVKMEITRNGDQFLIALAGEAATPAIYKDGSLVILGSNATVTHVKATDTVTVVSFFGTLEFRRRR